MKPAPSCVSFLLFFPPSCIGMSVCRLLFMGFIHEDWGGERQESPPPSHSPATFLIFTSSITSEWDILFLYIQRDFQQQEREREKAQFSADLLLCFCLSWLGWWWMMLIYLILSCLIHIFPSGGRRKHREDNLPSVLSTNIAIILTFLSLILLYEWSRSVVVLIRDALQKEAPTFFIAFLA